jgi:hypothetical protein
MVCMSTLMGLSTPDKPIDACGVVAADGVAASDDDERNTLAAASVLAKGFLVARSSLAGVDVAPFVLDASLLQETPELPTAASPHGTVDGDRAMPATRLGRSLRSGCGRMGTGDGSGQAGGLIGRSSQ